MATGGNKSSLGQASAVFCPARYASASVAGGCWSANCLIDSSKTIPVSL